MRDTALHDFTFHGKLLSASHQLEKEHGEPPHLPLPFYYLPIHSLNLPRFSGHEVYAAWLNNFCSYSIGLK
jgi:hypothetical protein